MKGDFTMKEIIKEIIEFDLDEGRMDYLDDMIDVFSKAVKWWISSSTDS